MAGLPLPDPREAPPLPLLRHRALWVRRPLDLEAMEEALSLLLGRHNFLGFAKEETRPGERELLRARLQVAEGEAGLEVRLYFRGKASSGARSGAWWAPSWRWGLGSGPRRA